MGAGNLGPLNPLFHKVYRRLALFITELSLFLFLPNVMRESRDPHLDTQMLILENRPTERTSLRRHRRRPRIVPSRPIGIESAAGVAPGSGISHDERDALVGRVPVGRRSWDSVAV